MLKRRPAPVRTVVGGPLSGPLRTRLARSSEGWGCPLSGGITVAINSARSITVHRPPNEMISDHFIAEAIATACGRDATKAAQPVDPWWLQLERVRGTTGFDGLERIITQTLPVSEFKNPLERL
jgi:hypothetical protein